MRCLLLLALAATACTDIPFNGPHYDSVRERLTDAPASLYVRRDASSGAITARRRDRDGWSSGTAAVAIEHGYVRAEIDDSGRIAVGELEIALGPIALDGVFSKPAELRDVHARLTDRVAADPTWTSADRAVATFAMTFDFDWSISFDGGEPYPLATQQLPPVDVDVVLDGDGDHVEASIDIAAAGELWSWADLLEVTELSLSLDAETAD